MIPRPRRLLLLPMLIAALAALPARADEVRIPVLVPLTGFLALEGTSQRNGAVLALTHPPAGLAVRYEVADTGTAPELAVNALEKALDQGPAVAVVASMLGQQILAMLPVGLEQKVPLITISGSVQVTEQSNPWVFRFFPSDSVVKVAQARYVVEELHKKRPAIVYQTTAYGQGGKTVLEATFKKLGVTPVFSEGVDTSVKDLLPVLTRVQAAHPDVLVIQLHAPSTALIIGQASSMGLGLPIVSGSAIGQPATAALLSPEQLKGVCAENASSPISGGSPAIESFVADYRKAFDTEPDSYALAQYDGVQMVLEAAKAGATTPEKMRQALVTMTYRGLAMTYKDDGKGNMAHSAIILCYDGTSRVPKIAVRYDDLGSSM
ncbi:MAG TPA: ABC transporter substrate-binding protein [Stellaceae bacterium]|nr:ABC transporter substrate-binding protein [Stellaceae bacterium]